MPSYNHDDELFVKKSSFFGRKEIHYQIGSGRMEWGEGLKIKYDKKTLKKADSKTFTVNKIGSQAKAESRRSSTSSR